MQLTLMNGIPVKVDPAKIESMGPHVDGGSVVKVNGNVFHVSEDLEKMFKNLETIKSLSRLANK